MDEPWLLRNSPDEYSVALKRKGSKIFTVASSKSLDSAGADLSATNSSVASAVNLPAGCDSTPLLIPTPSIPESCVSEEADGGCDESGSFTSAEVLSIIKAEKLVRQLRHRFDCQPDRFADVQKSLRQWLHQNITTSELHTAVRQHLSGAHPDDAAILESFRWFVTGSEQFHMQARCASHSPRSQRSSAHSASGFPRATSLPVR